MHVCEFTAGYIGKPIHEQTIAIVWGAFSLVHMGHDESDAQIYMQVVTTSLHCQRFYLLFWLKVLVASSQSKP